MFKIDFKSCLKIGVTIFALYLCIYYWPDVSGVFKGTVSAFTPIVVGAAFAYPLSILLNFYERHYFPRSKKKLVQKTRRGVCITLSFFSLILVISAIIALVVPQLVSCVKLLVAEIPVFYEGILAKLAGYDVFPENILDSLSKIDWKSSYIQGIETC